MTFVDTNALVSLLLPARGRQHHEAIAYVAENGPLVVSEAVLVEACWVLERAYRLDRADCSRLLREALDSESLISWDPVLVDRALDMMEGLRALSVVDCLLLARSYDGQTVLTFDRRLQRAMERL